MNPLGGTVCEVCGALLATAANRSAAERAVPAIDPGQVLDELAPSRERRALYDPGPSLEVPASKAPPAPRDPLRTAIFGDTLEPERMEPKPLSGSHSACTKPDGPTRRICGAVVELRSDSDSGPGVLHALRFGRNTVGRTVGCDVQVDDSRVSSHHGYLFIDDDGVRFIDVSSNGSVVDGTTVLGSTAGLHHGSRIQVGGRTLVVMLMSGNNR